MIGILDHDFIMTAKRKILPPPSLEAMKMGTYLRSEKIPFRLIQEPKEIHGCEKTYFFSQLPIDKIHPDFFNTDDVIEMFGPYLQGKLPESIHHLPPSIGIYNDIVERKVAEKLISPVRAIEFLDAIYYQAKINGNFIPVPPMQPRKKVYLYDEDILGYDDGWIILDKIIDKRPSSINTVLPLKCHKASQFFKLREDYEKVSRQNTIILDYFVPLSQLEAYFGKYKMKFLGEITSSSDINVFLGKNYNNNIYNDLFYLRNLFYNFNLLYSYYSRNIQVRTMIYEHETQTNPYELFFKKLKKWANGSEKKVTYEELFITEKDKKALKDLCASYPDFQAFCKLTKDNLKNTRGAWRII